MAWNLQGYPGRANDDEGTYVDRAWAMIYTHHLSNYTYNWDHPFFGWATIAAWAALTDGFHRDSRAVMVGRELMWVTTLVSCVLLFMLARRLGMRRVYAAAAVALFGLSPVDIWFHRMVSLDNLATTWALAAFVLAVSRRRSLGATLGSAICFAAATWSKETIALLLFPLAWLIWKNAGKTTRRRYLAAFGITYFGLAALYPLLAVLKGELLPGPRHVSLIGDAVYQLFTRTSRGSLLNPHSGTFAQVRSWVELDPWLVFGGAVALFVGLFITKYRHRTRSADTADSAS
jgi:intracellular septation protein A